MLLEVGVWGDTCRTETSCHPVRHSAGSRGSCGRAPVPGQVPEAHPTGAVEPPALNSNRAVWHTSRGRGGRQTGAGRGEAGKRLREGFPRKACSVAQGPSLWYRWAWGQRLWGQQVPLPRVSREVDPAAPGHRRPPKLARGPRKRQNSALEQERSRETPAPGGVPAARAQGDGATQLPFFSEENEGCRGQSTARGHGRP